MKKEMISFIFLFFIIFFPFINLHGEQYQRIIISPNGSAYFPMSSANMEKNEILIYNDQTKTQSLFYSYEKNNCIIEDLTIDPKGEKIAILEICMLSDGICSEKKPLGHYQLKILDIKTKKLLISFNHAFKYAFSPKGDAIVISSSDFPGRYDGCEPPPGYDYHTWIYFFKNKTKKMIETSDIGASDIIWSIFDGNVYFTNYFNVFKYDIKNSKGEMSALKGIYFSQDGKYYCTGGYEGIGSLIYRSADNQPMQEWNDFISKIDKNFHFVSWVLSGRAILIEVYQKDQNNIYNPSNIVFDTNKGEIIQKVDGLILGTNASGTKAAINPINEDAKKGINRNKVTIIDISVANTIAGPQYGPDQ